MASVGSTVKIFYFCLWYYASINHAKCFPMLASKSCAFTQAYDASIKMCDKNWNTRYFSSESETSDLCKVKNILLDDKSCFNLFQIIYHSLHITSETCYCFLCGKFDGRLEASAKENHALHAVECQVWHQDILREWCLNERNNTYREA